jgi:hypothetical protein
MRRERERERERDREVEEVRASKECGEKLGVLVQEFDCFGVPR